MPKTVPNRPGLEAGPYPFSKVVEANGFVFLAGQVGEEPGGHGAVTGGIGPETRAMLDNVGRLLRAVGLDYADVVEDHGLPARLRRLRGDERGLSRVLPDGAAGQGDGGRDRPGRGLPGRDRGPGRPLVRVPRSSSIATYGWPGVPTTSMTRVCLAAVDQLLLKTTLRAVNELDRG